MIITKTTSKYRVGSNRGYGIDVPNLAFKLNLIVDKERSTWPAPEDTRTEEERDSGVPLPEPVKEIEEGDVFELGGTVFAVDKDRLVQVVSETGPLAFQRIYNEIIEPELELSYFEDSDHTYSWEEVDSLPQDLQQFSPEYKYMKVWEDNFVTDRNLRPRYTIKVTMTDNLLGLSQILYITKDYKISYSEDDFTEEAIEYYYKRVLSWFYFKVGRVPVTKKEG